MLSFEIDGVERVVQRLDDMRAKIEHMARVELGSELSSWEIENLHRHRPHLRRRRVGASTIIRQHSWWETKGRRRVARKFIRKGRYVARWSTRPVLRPELFEELCERVAELVAEKLRW